MPDVTAIVRQYSVLAADSSAFTNLLDTSAAVEFTQHDLVSAELSLVP